MIVIYTLELDNLTYQMLFLKMLYLQYSLCVCVGVCVA